MIPIKNITVYIDSEDGSVYFESCKIKKVGEKYISNDSKPMSIEELNIFTKAHKKARKGSKIVNKPFTNVFNANFEDLENDGISTKSLILSWYSLPREQNMFFSKGLSIKSGKYFIPGLVWLFKKGELMIYAYFDQNPSMESKLYKAPLLNIYADDSVCIGTTIFNFNGIDNIEMAKKVIEESFFMSEFTHFNNVAIFAEKSENSYEKMTKEYLNEKDLKKTGLKIKDLWDTK